MTALKASKPIAGPRRSRQGQSSIVSPLRWQVARFISWRPFAIDRQAKVSQNQPESSEKLTGVSWPIQR